MKPNEEKTNLRKKRKKEIYPGVYFLGAISFLYFLLFLFKPGNIIEAIKASTDMFIHILPAFVLIVLLMGIVNHFVKPKTVSKYVGKSSGIKGWFLAICTGILSHGPIYIWYPLLRRLCLLRQLRHINRPNKEIKGPPVSFTKVLQTGTLDWI